MCSARVECQYYLYRLFVGLKYLICFTSSNYSKHFNSTYKINQIYQMICYTLSRIESLGPYLADDMARLENSPIQRRNSETISLNWFCRKMHWEDVYPQNHSQLAIYPSVYLNGGNRGTRKMPQTYHSCSFTFLSTLAWLTGMATKISGWNIFDMILTTIIIDACFAGVKTSCAVIFYSPISLWKKKLLGCNVLM